MSRKTLEEIEAVHAARAANKLGGQPVPEHESYPGDEVAPVDPADRSQGDAENPLEQELNKLRQQYSALQGRLTPTQQQLEEYRRLYDSERTGREAEANQLRAELDELRQQLEERSNTFDPAEFLTEEERELFDEETINMMAKVARAAAQAAAPKVDVRTEIEKAQQELAAKKINDYRTEVINDPSKGLTDLHQLAHNPAFNAWLEEEGNEDFEPLVRSMFQAQTTREIDRLSKAVAKRIAKYNGGAPEASTQSRPTDARTSLERASQRRPRSLTNSEMERKLHEAKQLARSRNPADRKRAEEIINSL